MWDGYLMLSLYRRYPEKFMDAPTGFGFVAHLFYVHLHHWFKKTWNNFLESQSTIPSSPVNKLGWMKIPHVQEVIEHFSPIAMLLAFRVPFSSFPQISSN